MSSYPRCIFLTGITGFLGSALAARFLNQGCRVAALVRSTARDTFESTINLLRWNGVEGAKLPNLHLIVGDIREKIKAKQLLQFDIDEVWHCAASFKYQKSSLTDIVQTNINGTHNMLDLAIHLNQSTPPKFVYISTAYVCGNREGLIAEKLQTQSSYDSFRNLYEWSKNESERLTAIYREKYGIRVLIFRPSIIVGDSHNGIAHTHGGYYGVLKALYHLKERLQHSKADKPAVELGLRLLADPEAQLNLVPIDFVIHAMDLLSKRSPDGISVFHITNESAPTIRQVVETACKSLNIGGLSFANEDDLLYKPMSVIESRFHRTIGFQVQYLSPKTFFETVRLRKLASHSDLPQPRITPLLLEKLNRKYFERLSNNAIGQYHNGATQGGIHESVHHQNPRLS